MSLHYLVKCLAQKIALSGSELGELPCKTQAFETVVKNIRPVMLASFAALTKRHLQRATPKNTE